MTKKGISGLVILLLLLDDFFASVLPLSWLYCEDLLSFHLCSTFYNFNWAHESIISVTDVLGM